MATDRPRIQAYLDPALYEHYEAWKKERGIDKDSPALNQLLAEYFGVSSQSPAPNPQSLITTEQIEEMIEEECSSRMQEIKEDIAAKLPTLTELDSKIDGYVQERMKEQSEEWMNQLGEKFYDRIYALEEKVRSLNQAASSNSLPETRSPEATARHENIAPSPEAISMRVIEACGSGNAQEDEPKSELPSELNLTQLARRLSISKSVVSNRKARADFEEWSKGKDPSGIAWRYDRSAQKFSPAKNS